MATRAWIATELGARLTRPLAVGNMTANDSTGNLKEPLDDALRMLGATEAELTDAGAVWFSDAYTLDFLLLAKYTTLRQIWHSMVSTFDLSSQGDSMKLSQRVGNVERLLKAAEAEVARRFGGIPVGALGEDGGLVTVDMNYLTQTVGVVGYDFPYTVVGVGDG